jgi:hypothetical protein
MVYQMVNRTLSITFNIFKVCIIAVGEVTLHCLDDDDCRLRNCKRPTILEHLPGKVHIFVVRVGTLHYLKGDQCSIFLNCDYKPEYVPGKMYIIDMRERTIKSYIKYITLYFIFSMHIRR